MAKLHFIPSPFSTDAMHYNSDGDYYVFPMGQQMERIGIKRGKNESGYTTESAHYRAKNCSGCPLHGQCFQGQGNRMVEVNHKFGGI